MYAIFFRTIFLYVFITVVIRLMGKRQVGELEMSELVTTLLLSQIASLPIEEPEIPIPHVILPVLFIVAVEIVITFAKSRINCLKRIFEPRPSFLIDRGRIDQREMAKMRITIGELLSEVRQQGYRDVGEVYYAILEENGKFSIIPRSDCEPVTPRDLGHTPRETGCALPIIQDGVIDKEALAHVGRGEEWLCEICRERGTLPSEVFLLTMDDSGSILLTEKEKK